MLCRIDLGAEFMPSKTKSNATSQSSVPGDTTVFMDEINKYVVNEDHLNICLYDICIICVYFI